MCGCAWKDHPSPGRWLPCPHRSPPSRSVAAAPERDGEGREAFTGLGDAKKPRLAAGPGAIPGVRAAPCRARRASGSRSWSTRLPLLRGFLLVGGAAPPLRFTVLPTREPAHWVGVGVRTRPRQPPSARLGRLEQGAPQATVRRGLGVGRGRDGPNKVGFFWGVAGVQMVGSAAHGKTPPPGRGRLCAATRRRTERTSCGTGA